MPTLTEVKTKLRNKRHKVFVDLNGIWRFFGNQQTNWIIRWFDSTLKLLDSGDNTTESKNAVNSKTLVEISDYCDDLMIGWGAWVINGMKPRLLETDINCATVAGFEPPCAFPKGCTSAIVRCVYEYDHLINTGIRYQRRLTTIKSNYDSDEYLANAILFSIHPRDSIDEIKGEIDKVLPDHVDEWSYHKRANFAGTFDYVIYYKPFSTHNYLNTLDSVMLAIKPFVSTTELVGVCVKYYL